MGSKERFYLDIMDVHPEVTGSCHLVVVKFPNCATIKFVVDCGLFQETGCEDFNKDLPFNANEIEFCVVTHNHVDHIGRLPLMVKNGFIGNIYTTNSTGRLLPLTLADSFKVLRDVSKRKNRKMLYDELDVFKTEALITPCNYEETFNANENIKVTFLKNGHLVGAALVLVQISYPHFDDINLFFTGDYNNKNMFFDVPNIPKWILKLPITVIQESTYGYMDSSCMEKVFNNNIIDCIKNNGTAIVPVFSLGRAQEILYEIKCMQNSGELSKDIPIYFDGKLAFKYTNLYLKGVLDINPEMKDFLPDNLTFVDKALRTQVLDDIGTKIVITTSGMGSYGPAQTYIPKYISQKNALIQFTGYTAEGTLGSRLKSSKCGENVEVGGLVVKKYAKVEYTTEYSAHAKADEMINFLKQFEILKLVLVNHGQTDVKIKFAKRILDEVEPKNVGILGRDYFFRINSFGLVKTLSTKFRM